MVESAAPAMAAVPINSRREIVLIAIPFVFEVTAMRG